ncbi:MAG: thiamine phosphate synthase [Campylobacterota bacterium]|nr:thiamine phosphate synthase [Campylobacterota bacterium]
MKENQLKKGAFNKPPFFISYFISDPTIFKNINAIFSKHTIDIACFRDKESSNIEPLALEFINNAKKSNIALVVINSHIDLAIKYNYDGVHLTSQQFDKIQLAKDKNLYVIISCHTEDEIKLAYQNGADAITYSPIFYKENKGEPKGIKNLKKVIELYQKDDFRIIALGGIIDDEHIKQIKQTNASGFASIRYFAN